MTEYQTVSSPAEDAPFGPPRLIPEPAFGGPGNDDVARAPVRSTGRALLEYDFPGVLVGSAHYEEGPTGATVIHVPAGARTATDPRGGAVGLSGAYSFNHAICLAGGSVYGLAAGAGVSDELLARKGNSTAFADLAEVSSAIIYDFSARDTAVAPDAALGRAAVRWAEEGTVPLGLAGAGIRASAGKVDWSRAELTGQGAAFRRIGDIRMLAVVVPNPVGVIVDRSGRIVRGNYDAAQDVRRHPALDFERALAAGIPVPVQPGNTTIGALITNVKLSDIELNQLCLQVHSSMHRGIQPFHTSMDGDTLFTLTTDEVDLPAPDPSVGRLSVSSAGLGALASEVMWDAILEAAR
ncbi:P1 family peptidase [Sediminivirga luteola]|uniref:Peptidase S58 n=1 Tax=Sediminivirga luteola TaxID=1774748 RepID=A0A8J2TXV4_9MICO|nr:P1 family peptidase [Sediminivirga luteola]GGA14346.1 peptidase S58 [Sediminivirga luteola]